MPAFLEGRGVPWKRAGAGPGRAGVRALHGGEWPGGHTVGHTMKTAYSPEDTV